MIEQQQNPTLPIHGVMPRLLFILQLFIKYLSIYLCVTIIHIIFVE
jgi:hypothetical protein